MNKLKLEQVEALLEALGEEDGKVCVHCYAPQGDKVGCCGDDTFIDPDYTDLLDDIY